LAEPEPAHQGFELGRHLNRLHRWRGIGTLRAHEGLRTTSQWRWRRDLNPRTVLAVSRFQGECIRPLCHATADKGSGVRPAGRPCSARDGPARAPRGRRIWWVSRLGTDGNASARPPIRQDPAGSLSNMSRTLTSNSDSWCTSVSRRLSIAHNRRVESTKFCHDLCSTMSSPGIGLAVRPAMRSAMASCHATQRLWNSPKARVVA
jgi:hypothetical protein